MAIRTKRKNRRFEKPRREGPIFQEELDLKINFFKKDYVPKDDPTFMWTRAPGLVAEVYDEWTKDKTDEPQQPLVEQLDYIFGRTWRIGQGTKHKLRKAVIIAIEGLAQVDSVKYDEEAIILL